VIADAEKVLADVTGRYARLHFEAVADLYVALVTGNRPAAFDACRALERAVTETMGAGEVLGAAITLRAAARELAAGQFARRMHFADEPTQLVLPRVTLSEALDDLVTRAPVTLQRAADRTAQRIAELYGQGRVLAFARAAEATVTAEAQRFLAQSFREGLGETEAGRGLAMAVDAVRRRTEAWSEAYARMVFRTTINTSVTAGRFRQAQDPDVKVAVPAFRFSTMEDVDVRPNHAAADGVVLSVDSQEWRRIAPPLGYNCRCQVHHVGRHELAAEGRLDANGRVVDDKVPAAAHPDEGFRHGGRPDLFGLPL
jgi:SPP1 gp7 family putative phage head morphogenesis protein